jgi:hypothetical protein
VNTAQFCWAWLLPHYDARCLLVGLESLAERRKKPVCFNLMAILSFFYQTKLIRRKVVLYSLINSSRLGRAVLSTSVTIRHGDVASETTSKTFVCVVLFCFICDTVRIFVVYFYLLSFLIL